MPDTFSLETGCTLAVVLEEGGHRFFHVLDITHHFCVFYQQFVFHPLHVFFPVSEEIQSFTVVALNEVIILSFIVVHPVVMLSQLLKIHLKSFFAWVHPKAWTVHLPLIVQFDEGGQDMRMFFTELASITHEVAVIHPECFSKEILQLYS